MRKFAITVNGQSYEVEVEEIGGAPVFAAGAGEPAAVQAIPADPLSDDGGEGGGDDDVYAEAYGDKPLLTIGEETAVSQMRAVLPLCDIVKISDEETRLLCGTDDPDEALEKLMSVGVRLAVVTLGARGAMWQAGSLRGLVPGFSVKVADTNGAGDTVFGAFLSRIAAHGGLAGLTEQEISGFVRFANRAASITASRPGAIPAMPTLREVEEGLI